MRTPIPMYKINQTVYAYTKNGLTECKIYHILISINQDENTTISYQLEKYGDFYNESLIIPTLKAAIKNLDKNKNQLTLMLI